jgi:hypothetical protein
LFGDGFGLIGFNNNFVVDVQDDIIKLAKGVAQNVVGRSLGNVFTRKPTP